MPLLDANVSQILRKNSNDDQKRSARISQTQLPLPSEDPEHPDFLFSQKPKSHFTNLTKSGNKFFDHGKVQVVFTGPNADDVELTAEHKEKLLHTVSRKVYL